MAKTLTIQIKSTSDAMKGFKDTFKALEAGRRVRRREGVYFRRHGQGKRRVEVPQTLFDQIALKIAI